MPATQRKCIYGGLTLDVDRHYIGSVTATTHQEKGIITLESNPSRGTALPAPHGKGNKCDKNVKYKELMYRHCGTNNRAPRWTSTDPCKPEVRPGARDESASPAWLAAPAMNARDTTKVYIWRLDTGCGPTLYRNCHSHNTPGVSSGTTWIGPVKWEFSSYVTCIAIYYFSNAEGVNRIPI